MALSYHTLKSIRHKSNCQEQMTVSSFRHCQRDVSFFAHCWHPHHNILNKCLYSEIKVIKEKSFIPPFQNLSLTTVAVIKPSISPRRNCSWFGLDILPLSHEKAATAEMIRHCMELIKKIIVDLSLTQIPVMRRISGHSLNFLEKIDLLYLLADFILKWLY